MKNYMILVFVLSCGPLKKPEDPKETTKDEQLRATYQENLALAYKVFDEKTHWPSVEDCDATLWAGIAACGGVKLDLSLAEHNPGQIHRRPYQACWSEKEGDQGSKSTTSNDMITGYMLGAWCNKDYEAVRRVAAYGEKHFWVMGEPFPEMASRVLLKPNGIITVGRLLYVLSGGKDSRFYAVDALKWYPVKGDYERHIQALSIMLSGEIRETGSFDQIPTDLREDELKRVEALAKKEPKNFLYSYILSVYSGDYEKTLTLLLDEKNPVPTYVRGKNPKAFMLAEWLLIANNTLERYGRKDSL